VPVTESLPVKACHTCYASWCAGMSVKDWFKIISQDEGFPIKSCINSDFRKGGYEGDLFSAGKCRIRGDSFSLLRIWDGRFYNFVGSS